MKLYIEDNELIPAIIVQDDATAAPTGYTETSDIALVAEHGEANINEKLKGFRDKSSVRSKLKTLIYTKMQIAAPADVEDQAKFDLLTAAEKSIACHWFLVGKESFQLEVINDDKYWTQEAGEYRRWTMESRGKRLNRMESIVFRRLQSVSDAKQVLSDMNQIAKDTVLDFNDITKVLNTKIKVKKLTSMYVEGMESLEDDGVVGLKDYINSTVGTPFENNGFRGLTYTFRTGYTAGSVADELIEIMEGTW